MKFPEYNYAGQLMREGEPYGSRPENVPAGSPSSSQIDSTGRMLFTADAHRSDGRRFMVRSGEKLTVFLELERNHVR